MLEEEVFFYIVQNYLAPHLYPGMIPFFFKIITFLSVFGDDLINSFSGKRGFFNTTLESFLKDTGYQVSFMMMHSKYTGDVYIIRGTMQYGLGFSYGASFYQAYLLLVRPDMFPTDIVMTHETCVRLFHGTLLMDFCEQGDKDFGEKSIDYDCTIFKEDEEGNSFAVNETGTAIIPALNACFFDVEKVTPRKLLGLYQEHLLQRDVFLDLNLPIIYCYLTLRKFPTRFEQELMVQRYYNMDPNYHPTDDFDPFLL